MFLKLLLLSQLLALSCAYQMQAASSLDVHRGSSRDASVYSDEQTLDDQNDEHHLKLETTTEQPQIEPVDEGVAKRPEDELAAVDDGLAINDNGMVVAQPTTPEPTTTTTTPEPTTTTTTTTTIPKPTQKPEPHAYPHPNPYQHKHPFAFGHEQPRTHFAAPPAYGGYPSFGHHYSPHAHPPSFYYPYQHFPGLPAHEDKKSSEENEEPTTEVAKSAEDGQMKPDFGYPPVLIVPQRPGLPLYPGLVRRGGYGGGGYGGGGYGGGGFGGGGGYGSPYGYGR